MIQHKCVTACKWRSKTTWPCWSQFSPSITWVLEDSTQVLDLEGNYLYPLSHLVYPTSRILERCFRAIYLGLPDDSKN